MVLKPFYLFRVFLAGMLILSTQTKYFLIRQSLMTYHSLEYFIVRAWKRFPIFYGIAALLW